MLTGADKNNNQFITLCLIAIVEDIFNRTYDILEIMVQKANTHQLKAMYQIIKNLKLIQDHNEDEQKQIMETKNIFDSLSRESIQNICSFLGRRNINHVK